MDRSSGNGHLPSVPLPPPKSPRRPAGHLMQPEKLPRYEHSAGFIGALGILESSAGTARSLLPSKFQAGAPISPRTH